MCREGAQLESLPEARVTRRGLDWRLLNVAGHPVCGPRGNQDESSTKAGTKSGFQEDFCWNWGPHVKWNTRTAEGGLGQESGTRWDMFRNPISSISLILLGLIFGSSASLRADPGKSGRTRATPPEKRGVMWPR